MNEFGRPHLFGLLAGLFLAAGLILSAMVVTRAWLHVSESEVVSVTGAAAQDVVADLIIWRGSFSVEDATLAKAQDRWAADREKVEGFFRERAITNVTFTPLAVSELRSTPTQQNPDVRVIGYSLTQGLEITSTNVLRLKDLGPETVALVKNGVLFTAQAPDFIYTRAGEAKITMLAEATKDARARAMQIASEGRRKLGNLRSARMGVFQITRRHSTETSWEGLNDTSTYEKTIRSIVSATFAIE